MLWKKRNVWEQHTGLVLRAAGGFAMEEVKEIAEVKEIEAKMSKKRGYDFRVMYRLSTMGRCWSGRISMRSGTACDD